MANEKAPSVTLKRLGACLSHSILSAMRNFASSQSNSPDQLQMNAVDQLKKYRALKEEQMASLSAALADMRKLEAEGFLRWCLLK